MFRRLLSLVSSSTPSVAPRGTIPAGERVYAVGDIHGRLDLLDDLLTMIDQDDAGRPPVATSLIFLGDLIDRGPHSAQVVQRLLELSADMPEIRFLLGNHEEVFLKAIAGEKGALPFFLKIGGRPTLLSYGIDEESYQRASYEELHAMLLERIPHTHIDFLDRFEDMIVIGDYAFVHAGVNPLLPLATQPVGALRWIRDEFLNHREPLEKIVVHGHTITEQVEETSCRIGIDTGAHMSGRLTALGFEGDQRWVLQTDRNG